LQHCDVVLEVPQVRESVALQSQQVKPPFHDTLETLHHLLAIDIAVTAAGLVVAADLGWWLVRVRLAPLAAVKQTAAAIADGQLDRRVPGDNADTDVGQVARALNVMLARIEECWPTSGPIHRRAPPPK
jgi:methyl-accepting chemotaxis protein